MKRFSITVDSSQSNYTSEACNCFENGSSKSTPHRLWSLDYQRNSWSCNCHIHEPHLPHCGKHGLSKYCIEQATFPRKEKTLTKFFYNIFRPSSTSSTLKNSLRNESCQFKCSSQPSPMMMGTQDNVPKIGCNHRRKTASSSFFLKLSTMKLKFLRRNVSPRPEELSQGPSTSTGVSGAPAKSKPRTRRTSKNPSLCPFSPSTSPLSSEDERPKSPENSNALVRIARNIRLHFHAPEQQAAPPQRPQRLSPNENIFLTNFTEILANPSLGSPSERAELAIHSTIEFTNVLVPDMITITAAPYYWGMMDRYEAETLLEGKPEGTFLLRDSAQINYLFSVSFRRYSRTLHARIEHSNGIYSFDIHDDSYHRAKKISDLVENYRDPKQCLFYEPQLSIPLKREFAFDLKHLCRAVITSRTTYENISALPLPTSLKKYLREYHFKQPIRVTDHDC